ncbi:uncharacterized protein LOC131145528 [Malania oleifera]|uniref:uncharacterized protein LOC131145528 n=1 Tax=Malania oleifera TaxID=397392 RepID=UPI0025AEBF99|nr:uncharacterized protein LOC131145528 [Malania oleifera]
MPTTASITKLPLFIPRYSRYLPLLAFSHFASHQLKFMTGSDSQSLSLSLGHVFLNFSGFCEISLGFTAKAIDFGGRTLGSALDPVRISTKRFQEQLIFGRGLRFGVLSGYFFITSGDLVFCLLQSLLYKEV